MTRKTFTGLFLPLALVLFAVLPVTRELPMAGKAGTADCLGFPFVYLQKNPGFHFQLWFLPWLLDLLIYVLAAWILYFALKKAAPRLRLEPSLLVRGILLLAGISVWLWMTAGLFILSSVQGGFFPG